MKKRLSVLVLAIAMVLTMSASVFAAGQNSSTQNPSSAAGDAAIVKYVQAPEGVTLDGDMTFTFTFTKHAPSNSTYGVPVDNTWTDTSASIKISEMNDAAAAADADTGNLVGTKTIASIFTGYTFPRAGEYTFKVKETAGSASGWTYAEDEYLLRLVVDNEGNIDDVTVQEVTTDPTTGDETPGDKVNPEDVTPGDNGDDGNDATTDDPEPTPADSLGGFTFTNLYKPTVTTHDEPGNKNPDPDPTDPTQPGDINEGPDTPENPDIVKEDQPGAFELDKFVLGEYGDQSKAWTFNVTVALPKNYKDFTLPTGWTDGTAKGVDLKHGENFKFAELPVGTKITVAEVGANANGYTTVWATSEDDDALVVLVTEDGGYAICRNSFDDTSVTPTGIIINNLPYVLLIGLAIGGIVLFSRKKRYE